MLKPAYGDAICCFRKLSQTVSQVLMSVDKFKQVLNMSVNLI